MGHFNIHLVLIDEANIYFHDWIPASCQDEHTMSSEFARKQSLEFNVERVSQLLHASLDGKDDVAENHWLMSCAIRTCDGNGSGMR
jgi:hypothetical protein